LITAHVNKVCGETVLCSMKTDFIIVGQGLAGTMLAHELLKAGKTIVVVDSSKPQKASAVAAGLVNPVVFRRLTQSWLIDDLYPRLEQTYAELEVLLGCRIYYPMKIRKLFGLGEASFWKKKVEENKLNGYLNVEPDYSSYPDVYTEHGSGWVEKSGRVDLNALLSRFRNYLLEKSQLIDEQFDFDKLKFVGDEVLYEGLQAKKIIFCEGHRGAQNMFFKNIEFKHTKGEVLSVETKDYNAEFILNKAFFLMPVGNREFRVGATYDWNNLDEIPTSGAREELCTKLEQVFAGEYRISDHQAGIRPTTHDRRPVAGLHPTFPQVGIFNGLGSKGCMLAPYFAVQLADVLTGASGDLMPEVNVSRYF